MKRVYFIKPMGMDGPIKVGCSVSPDNRRRTLETWSPFPLEVVAEVAGDFDLERRFHALFIETHIRREWFGWSRRIATVIAAINAGTFDVSTLPEPLHVSDREAGEKRKKPARTDAQRKQQSYALRIHHTYRRTGWDSRMYVRDCVERGDALAVSYFEAYLAEPHRWGRAIDADWARALQARHQALLAEADQAAAA